MKTTDHATDHVCEASLIEQLKSIPLKSREWIKDEKGLGLRNIPYGRYCQEAAEALQNAEAEVKSLTEKLTSLQEAYLQSVERDNNLTQALFDSRAEVKRLTELLEFSQEKPIY